MSNVALFHFVKTVFLKNKIEKKKDVFKRVFKFLKVKVKGTRNPGTYTSFYRSESRFSKTPI